MGVNNQSCINLLQLNSELWFCVQLKAAEEQSQDSELWFCVQLKAAEEQSQNSELWFCVQLKAAEEQSQDVCGQSVAHGCEGRLPRTL